MSKSMSLEAFSDEETVFHFVLKPQQRCSVSFSQVKIFMTQAMTVDYRYDSENEQFYFLKILNFKTHYFWFNLFSQNIFYSCKPARIGAIQRPKHTNNMDTL